MMLSCNFSPYNNNEFNYDVGIAHSNISGIEIQDK